MSQPPQEPSSSNQATNAAPILDGNAPNEANVVPTPPNDNAQAVTPIEVPSAPASRPKQSRKRQFTHISINSYPKKIPKKNKDFFQFCKCKKICGKKCINRQLGHECQPDCRAKDCGNQVLQKMIFPKTDVRDCGKKGKGVITPHKILKGQVIAEYVGQVVPNKETVKRKRRYKKRGNIHVYLFGIGSHIIDATVKGNDARYINHSCNPNCKSVMLYVPGTPGNLPRIAIVAKRDIKEDEEITINYGFTGDIGTDCACGSDNCSGKMGVLKKSVGDEEKADADLQVVKSRKRVAISSQKSSKRQRLDPSVHQFEIFNSNADDILAKMDEKDDEFSSDDFGSTLRSVRNFQQKHGKDFADIECEVQQFDEEAAKLAEADQDHTDAIIQKKNDIKDAWNVLKEKAQQRKDGLENNYQFHRFLADCRDRDKDIKQMEKDIKADKLAKDAAKARDIDNFLKELEDHQIQINEINQIADKLIEEGHLEYIQICGKRDGVNEAWHRLNTLAAIMKERLFEAQVQRFNETLASISEKNCDLSSGDFGTDLNNVQELQKKHENYEIEHAVLDLKVQQLDKDASSLAKTYPNRAGDIFQKNDDTKVAWNALKEKAQQRKDGLERSYQLHRFLADYRDLLNSIEDKKTVIGADELAEIVAGAEELLESHIHRKGEIDARENSFNQTASAGQKLVGISESPEVREKLEKLAQEKAALIELWEERRNSYEQLDQDQDNNDLYYDDEKSSCIAVDLRDDLCEIDDSPCDSLESNAEVQQFQQDIDKAKYWIQEKDAAIDSEDFGKDLSLVQALQREHEKVESNLAAFGDEEIKPLNEKADRLRESHAEAAEQICNLQRDLNDQWNRLTSKANDRKEKLLDSHYQRFLSDHRDLMQWIASMNQLVSSQELTNDLTRNEALFGHSRHLKNRTEIDSRDAAFQAFDELGNELLKNYHYAKKDIETRLQDVDVARKGLRDACVARRNILDQCLERFFLEDCEKIVHWISARMEFISKEHSIEDNIDSLLQQVKQYQDETNGQQKPMNDFHSVAAAIIEDDRTSAEQRYNQVVKKWKSFKEELELKYAKLKKLEESKHLQLFLCEIHTIERKIAVKSKGAQGNRQQDQAKLYAIFNQIAIIIQIGTNLINNAKCGGNEAAINARLESLKDERSSIAKMIFLASAKNLQSWIGVMASLVQSKDYGMDMASVENHLEMNLIVEADITAKQLRVNELKNLADLLLKIDHIQGQKIAERRKLITDRYDKIKKMAADRRDKLSELLKMHQLSSSSSSPSLENTEKDMIDSEKCDSLEEVRALGNEFKNAVSLCEPELVEMQDVNSCVTTFSIDANSPTSSSSNISKEDWNDSQSIIKNREVEVQKKNDSLRGEFARLANCFQTWVTNTKKETMEAGESLETELDAVKRIVEEIRTIRSELKQIGEKGDFHHTLSFNGRSQQEFSMACDDLVQNVLRNQHKLEFQIQAKNQLRVLQHFSKILNNFDKRKTERILYRQFKRCLLGAGYNFAMMNGGQSESNFQRILNVDKNGFVTFQNYMVFMIIKKTENVQSLKEIEIAFGALSKCFQSYATAEELFFSLTEKEAEIFITRMTLHMDAISGRSNQRRLE